MLGLLRHPIRAVLSVPTVIGIAVLFYAAGYIGFSEPVANAAPVGQDEVTERRFSHHAMPGLFGPAAHMESYFRGHRVVLTCDEVAHEQPRPEAGLFAVEKS